MPRRNEQWIELGIMVIYVNDSQLGKELASRGIRSLSGTVDFSLIEQECVLAIINFKIVDRLDNLAKTLAGLIRSYFPIIAIIDQDNENMISKLHKFDLVLFREDQLRSLLDDPFLTLVEEIGDRLLRADNMIERSTIRYSVRNAIWKGFGNG